MRNLLLTCFFSLPLFLWGQSDSITLPDSPVMELNVEQFMELVRQHHPLAKAAGLQDDMGEANLRKARGGFDPYLKADYRQKQFSDDLYFEELEGGIAVPIWPGMEAKGMFQNTTGIYLNPENTTPQIGLLKLGLKVNLLRGLFFDTRRADVRKAQAFLESSKIEQELMLNDLMLNALAAYWEWVRHYHQFEVYTEAAGLAQTRQDGVRSAFRNGDKPAIDTLEALIQVQTREFHARESFIKFQKSHFDLLSYIWEEDGNNSSGTWLPPSLENLIPDAEDWPEGSLLPDGDNNPRLKQYMLKLEMLDVDRRLKAEYLKPKLSIEYNYLSEPAFSDAMGGTWGDLSNRQWAAGFSMPVFLRKERGNLQLARLKIQETRFEFQQKQAEIRNKMQAFRTNLELMRGQIGLYVGTVSNYRNLVAGEVRKFELGESSLFIINTREQNLIKARLELIAVQTDYPVMWASYLWLLGDLK